MAITDDLVLRHSATVTWRQYLKSVVIEPGFALNETAAAVFTRIDGKRTVGDIAREIAEEFSVDLPTCQSDVHELVGEFVERGFVVDASAPAAN
jgi:hypothetical protein